MIHSPIPSFVQKSGWLLLLMFLLGSGAKSSAQTRIPREIHLGAVGGAVLSEYTFHPSVTQKMTRGYTAGVAVRYIEETLFGLQAEFHLTQRGYSDYYEGEPDLQFTRKLTYLELPIMAHVYFKVGQKHEVTFDAGPKLGYYLWDTTESTLPDNFGQLGDVNHFGYVYKHHILPIEKKFDYGIQAGLGYEFKFNKQMSAQISGRYYYGLGNMWPDSKADDFEVSSNQSIQVVFSLWWKHTIRGKKVVRDAKGK